MEKGKPGPRRGAQPKMRSLPPTGDFIALGPKSSGSNSRQGSDSLLDPKMSLGASKSSSSTSSLDRKKDSSSGSLIGGSKKGKLPSSLAVIAPAGRNLAERKEVASVHVTEHWEAISETVDPTELVSIVLRSNDDDKIDALLCGAVKQMKTHRTKYDPSLYLGLLYLAKVKPNHFSSEIVIEALSSMLKKNVTGFKTKGTNLLPVLSANILLCALQEERHWPEILVKVYIDDSIGDRIWVDHAECKGFVDNILTAFNTTLPSQSQLTSDLNFKPDCPSPTPSTVAEDDESSDSALLLECREIMEDVTVQNRFGLYKSKVEKMILDIVKDQLTKRQQPMDISRNMLRLLASACGLSEVRLMAAQRLEVWLQHTKLTRPAQDLLMALSLNCRLHNQNDVEVISLLTRIRLKAKPLVNHYLQCIRELLDKHPENLSTVIKHTIYNELSNTRNPNNMAVISVIFQHSPEQAAKMLAEVFQDLLSNKDDYLRALRALLREIVRTLRYDMQFSTFCLGLMSDRKDQVFKDLDQSLKERMFLSLGDLITMTIFLAISPSVKDAASAYLKGDRKDLHTLKSYQNHIATIQRDAVWWLHTIVMSMFRVGRNEFIHCLHKILFMEQAEHYFNKDNWPSEGERMLMIRLASEMPVLEDTLMRVLIIGQSKEHPLNSQDALELADQLVRRASSLHCENYPVLKIERLEFIELLFNLCVYHHPESIVLPKGYQPPSLAISKLYWKVWIILLITVAHNPGTFGLAAWQIYATIRMLIEMCITGHYTFPPPTLASGDKADEIKGKELQLSQLEKQEILQFESHLAAASTNMTITEENSLLLAQLTTLDPQGIARHPPAQVLEQLKSLNNNLKLGHLLCRCRNPDFLLDIIQRQGSSESMPWLAELVASSAGSFDMLPIQCLCEFLLHEPILVRFADEEKDEKTDKVELAKMKMKQKKQRQLLQYMKTRLFDASSDSTASGEILDYFLRRLSSKMSSARLLAVQGLQMVLCRSLDPDEEEAKGEKQDKDNPYSWVQQLTLLPHFKTIKRQAGLNLRQACKIENNPVAVGAYVKFLASYHPADTLQDLSELALDVAHVLVTRTTLVNALIPSEDSIDPDYSVQNALIRMFVNYLPRALKIAKEAYTWSISQDQILVQWPSGYAATMHILIAHAMVVLLTYGPPTDNPKGYETLLEHWFPSEGEPPQAFLVDTSELALLFPDWLKLKMISSKVDRLVDSALKDLEPSQLVLFVQSFGIPVPTVSKLLHSLDTGAEMDQEALKQAVVHKSYMCQLVDAQRQRGASGGKEFVAILRDHGEAEDDEEDMHVEGSQTVEKGIEKPVEFPILGRIADSLLQVFCPTEPDPKHQRTVFNSFMKNLSRSSLKKDDSSTFVVDLQNSITQILFSPNCVKFVSGLNNYTCYSCALFSLIFQCQSDHTRLKLYLPMVNAIIQHSDSTKSSLLSLIKKNSAKVQGLLTKNDDCEEVKTRIWKGEWRRANSADLVSKMLSFVSKSDTSDDGSPDKIGMYADGIKLIEPEILNLGSDFEKKLLFSPQSAKPGKVSCRQYLLAQLIHHTNWTTIHRAIKICLNDSNVRMSSKDPSAVLDFLSACVDIPRLWQGRDKNKSKHLTEGNVLAQNPVQTCSLVDHIVEEAFLASSASKSDPTISLVKISSRMPLLLNCLNGRSDLVDAVVGHMLPVILEQGERSSVMRQMLVSLYSKIPNLILLARKENFHLEANDCKVTQMGVSSLDVISHNLLTSLATVKPGKQGSQRLNDLEIECRKMAATHPLLLIRQMPMIAASLNGRLSFEFIVFVSRNYLAYFSCIMGLLELMKPFVYIELYCTSLQKIFDSFYEFVQIFAFKNKQAVPLTQRLLKLTLDYLNSSSNQSYNIITKHINILKSLAERYPDMHNLKTLVDLLSNEKSPKNGTDGAKELAQPRAPSRVSFGVGLPVNRSQVTSLLFQLSSENTEEILSALHDLNNIGLRNPSILEQVVDSVKKFMLSAHCRCRELSYYLVMLHLKNNPDYATDFLKIFNSCLNNENSDILITALEHLAEVIIMSQEHAKGLLDKVFDLGIKSGIDVKPYISETLFLLSMQDGL